MNICNFYILCWCVFNVTFATRNMISRPLFVVIFIITVYYVFQAYRDYKLPRYFHGLTALLGLFTVYGIALMLSDERHYIEYANNKFVDNEIFLISVYKSLLPIYPFFVFSRKGMITDNDLRRWLVVFIVATVITFLQTYQIMLMQSATGRTEFVNNQGNVFLALLPLAFFVQDKRWRYMLLAVILFFTLIAMKRGAIITGALVVGWILWRTVSDSKRSQRLAVLVGALALLLAGYLAVAYIYGTSDFFHARVESTLAGKSSERDVIYADMLNYYFNRATQMQQLIGSGSNATLDVSFNYAHNDWLEILVNQGILGILVYIFYWFCFYKQWRRMSRHTTEYAVFGAVLMIYFLRTLFSMSYADMSSYATLALGYCLGKMDTKKKNIIVRQ